MIVIFIIYIILNIIQCLILTSNISVNYVHIIITIIIFIIIIIIIIVKTAIYSKGDKQHELVSLEGVEEELMGSRQEIHEWKRGANSKMKDFLFHRFIDMGMCAKK